MSQLEFSSVDEGNSSDEDYHLTSNEWHHQLAKSFISMYDNIHDIITNFDEILQNTEMNYYQNKIKVEMMRMALILNPSDLSKWNIDELNSPSIDLRQFDDVNKCSEHEKLRSRINRIMMKLKQGMEKLQLILLNSSFDDQSSYYINNYRKKTEIYLTEICTQMIKFQNDELTKHQKIINELIIKNPLNEERIEDYKIKLRLNKSNGTYELFSSPLLKIDKKLIKIKDPIKISEFPDLIHQANEFFDMNS